MSLVPWRQRHEGRSAGPLNSITRFRDEMDDIFSRFFEPHDLGRSLTSGFAFGPRMDVTESDKTITMTVELPGVSPEDIELNVTGNMLSIKGEKKSCHEDNDGESQYAERQFGCFQRCVQLSPSVDADSVEANFKNGILTVTLAKKPDAVAKRISVKAG
jgi:HSP20 family protein